MKSDVNRRKARCFLKERAECLQQGLKAACIIDQSLSPVPGAPDGRALPLRGQTDAHASMEAGASQGPDIGSLLSYNTALQNVVQGTTNCLPYDTTLHHADCGCPATWIRGQRAADLVDLLVHRAVLAYQQRELVPTRPLRVAYMLPHHNITGGMKCLVEHIRLLKARGHTTIAVHRSDTAERAMPPWTQVQADVDLVCRLHERLNDVYDVNAIDVVVVGIFHQVAELLVGVAAPILYWEQGHEWLFGDPVRFQAAHNYAKQDQLFHMVLHLPVALAAVSEAVQNILAQEFGRAAICVPNAVDCQRFCPGPPADIPPSYILTTVKGQRAHSGGAQRSVLIVGNPALPLKGFDVAVAVLTAVNRVLPLMVTWVCQVQPSAATVPQLVGSGLRLHLHVSPAQEDLPALYRGHDAFLFTSRYEAWGMPVLEAMASGLAVVATRCLGVESFAQHGTNCLLADPQDVVGLARALCAVLIDASVRQHLQSAARTTALRFTPAAIVDRLESVLYSLAAASHELVQLRQAAAPDLQTACAWASHACAKKPSSASS
ncbi:hypothetical protein WJX73_010532 [Symbiochloris irregularis]|uniref:Glycosyltransferase n=1 Tax=Symbiochloris irregularis TaxID=706552 RepID=A0AAW1PZ39_9CHLO